MWFPTVVALALAARAGSDCGKSLIPDLSYKLSGLNVVFPCEATKNIFLQSGRYLPKNIIVTRIQLFKDDAIVAIPRFKHGTPFTLGKFSMKSKGCQASIEPFPCWDIQEEGNCEALQNVVDIFLDPRDVLWVLDLGICNTLEQPVLRCPPKILGINAISGEVIRIIDISSFITPESRFQYLVVDYSPEGGAFIYASDAGTASILVYDVVGERGHRIVLPPEVISGSVKDVLYILLTRKSSGNVLYFGYLTSPRLFSIRSSHLQSGQAGGAIVDVGVKPVGSAGLVLLGTDNAAAIFFRYKGESDIFIWNTDTAFKPENFLLVQKGSDCRLSTQVVPGYKRLMWAIESNFHDYFSDTVGCLGASIAVHPLIKTYE